MLAGFEVHYRIRVGDFRIGLKLENDIVNFVVFEHRNDRNAMSGIAIETKENLNLIRFTAILDKGYL